MRGLCESKADTISVTGITLSMFKLIKPTLIF